MIVEDKIEIPTVDGTAEEIFFAQNMADGR